jgi:hypothetical protein
MAPSAYWAQFTPIFVRNERHSYFDEFQRLATQRNWKDGSKRYRKEWVKCCAAEFKAVYDYPNASKLEGWKMLCADVGYNNIPNSITQCKKVSLECSASPIGALWRKFVLSIWPGTLKLLVASINYVCQPC